MDGKGNTLGISWHDSACIPNLNPGNIMDYFTDRSNPFYDRTCNNEVVKMQRLSLDQLNNMTGLEYILLHCQEPILYVIRKQHRHTPSHATPLADYYIIAGVVYQAPDMGSVINSRILSAVHHIQGAFEKTQSYSRYQPSKGYWWDFKEQEVNDVQKKPKDKSKEEPSSVFQRQRVDVLLAELTKKFPPKVVAPAIVPPQQQQAAVAALDKAAAAQSGAEEQPVKPQPSQLALQQQQAPLPPPSQPLQQQQQPVIEPKVEVKQEKTTELATCGVVAVSSTAAPTPQAAAGKTTPKGPVEKRPRLMV